MNTLFKFLSLSCVISWASTASTQTYEAIDLASPAGAVGLQGNRVAGYQNVNVGTGVTRRATLWEGAGLVDLHPSFVQSSAYSSVLGASGSLQVGVASDPLLGACSRRYGGTVPLHQRKGSPFRSKQWRHMQPEPTELRS